MLDLREGPYSGICCVTFDFGNDKTCFGLIEEFQELGGIFPASRLGKRRSR